MTAPEKTAGQVAYEAFMTAHWGNDGGWDTLHEKQRVSWEASAKAVLDAAGGLVDFGGLVDDGFEGLG